MKKAQRQLAVTRPLWFTRSALHEAFQRGGCAICTTLRASERKGIHSFLYEGMMSPSVRQKFLDGGGFCARHFRMAKQIEEQTWPAGGIGMAILCEGLLRVADCNLQNSGNSSASMITSSGTSRQGRRRMRENARWGF